jgi:pimeloyl-ACP methyl ester carboxylesterase
MPKFERSAEYIHPMQLQGLKGRVLHIPGPKGSKSQVMFVYGHHSSLERWWGVMDLFSRHHTITMPDLPGFGGMESLYKNDQVASFDNLADWLAEFVRKTYKGQKVTLVGMSLGFVIITRMLQRHPDLTQNINKLVSLFGFASSDDFRMAPNGRFWNSLLVRFLSLPISSDLYRLILLNPTVLRAGYHKTKNARQKFAGLTNDQKREAMDFEVELWQINDVRTHMHTAAEFLTFKPAPEKVDLPVYHIAVHNDRYFKLESVENHYRQIFSDYRLLVELKSGTHAPAVVRTADEASGIVTKELLEL